MGKFCFVQYINLWFARPSNKHDSNCIFEEIEEDYIHRQHAFFFYSRKMNNYAIFMIQEEYVAKTRMLCVLVVHNEKILTKML